MSLLERIDVIEDALKSILQLLEANKEKLDRLLAKGTMVGTINVDTAENDPNIEPIIATTEEVDMDFKGITVMNQTEKGLLVVKKGYQQWLAKQFIENKLKYYDNGTIYNIILKENSPTSGKPIGWLTKKWEKFKVVKN